jgi:hypothetical protein
LRSAPCFLIFRVRISLFLFRLSLRSSLSLKDLSFVVVVVVAIGFDSIRSLLLSLVVCGLLPSLVVCRLSSSRLSFFRLPSVVFPHVFRRQSYQLSSH